MNKPINYAFILLFIISQREKYDVRVFIFIFLGIKIVP